ncbi:MAG: hypothetical protein Q9170_008139 [Blastenia crenularia]
MAPKFQAVKYQWKCDRPEDPEEADDLMDAAYKATKLREPSPKVILVRSKVHMTTYYGGQYVADKPHITVSYKNAQQVKNKTHGTCHGYTKTAKDLQIVDAKSTGFVKPDATVDNKGKPIWPGGLEEEEKYHPV